MAQVDYPAILEEAWRQHLAPRVSNAPTVISTFAGCGGSSLGYSMAGYRELLAVEWDDNAVATFKLNFPDVPVYHGDIHKLTVEHCLELAGIEARELDLLDGSPPCQGFSTAGKRQIDDKRNQLYMEFVRLLRGLQPKVFVMENVSGLVKGKMKLVFADIMRELKASGYEVRCKLLNAMYFHVPQSRQRLIWIGVRDGLAGEVSFPKAQGRPITVQEAILQDGMILYRCGYEKGSTHVRKKQFQEVSTALTKTLAGCQHVVTSSAATEISQDQPALPLSEQYLMYYRNAGAGKTVGKFGSSKRLDAGKPSTTLSKSESYGGTYHPTEPRGLSTGERKRLASFPDAIKFTDWANAVEQIGNSVPPLMMRAIASHIKQEILNFT